MTELRAFDPTDACVREVADRFGTPAYLYDEKSLLARAGRLLKFPAPFGLTARFAVKANPNRAVIRLFAQAGLGFDASTVYEARRVLAAGVEPGRVQLTAQIVPDGFEDLVRAGVRFTACSLSQLERFGCAFPGTELGVRINPGQGSGGNNRTSVAGPDASFGIWHEALDDVLAVAAAHGLRITHAHHHVGSGGDPAKWVAIAGRTLHLVERLPDVTTVNLGGGFKVARVQGETATDMDAAGADAAELVRGLAERTGRRLRMEIEPGTWLAANCGVVVARVADVVSTGPQGHRFVKLDAGMAEILRPAMYGAQHPIRFVQADPLTAPGRAGPLVIVGPCCESGDILTPAPGDPEGLGARTLPVPCRGDLAVIAGAGAYCAGMAAKNYNSIPAAPEILLRPRGELQVVRRRQALEDVFRDE